jgi:DNA processing protein
VTRPDPLGAAPVADDAAAAAVLLACPLLRPGRAGALVARHGTPAAALAAARAGQVGEVDADPEAVAGWVAGPAAARAAASARHLGVAAWHPGGALWPVRDAPPGGPSLLLARGTLDVRAPRVAIVGTRAATPPGLADARAVATALARSGIVVVSGLAIGIDGAAHEGATWSTRGATAICSIVWRAKEPS